MNTNISTDVIPLFTEGLKHEAEGNSIRALESFMLAWYTAETSQEKYIAAQQIIKHQQTVQDKLHWNEIALEHAINMLDEQIKLHLPLLYYNVGSCYELLQDRVNAHKNLELAYLHLNSEVDQNAIAEIKSKFAQVLAERKQLNNLR